jgi:hypothetical protein
MAEIKVEAVKIPAPSAVPIVERHVQQAIAPSLGDYKALRSCAPTCFFMLAKAQGYLLDGPGSDLVSFVAGLDWERDFAEDRGWIRPWMCRTMRGRYGLSIVSWRLGGNTGASDETIAKMRSTGYLQSDQEVAFYRDQVMDRDIADIVGDGYPMIVGVLPEFGRNQREHAIIINHWSNGEVEVIDPDERNAFRVYPESYVRAHLNPNGGGCTVILPQSV